MSQSHDIKFLQDFNIFFGTASIPQRASNTPFFVIVQYGCNDGVYKAKVCCCVVIKLPQYFIQLNPMYQCRLLDMDEVNEFT